MIKNITACLCLVIREMYNYFLQGISLGTSKGRLMIFIAFPLYVFCVSCYGMKGGLSIFLAVLTQPPKKLSPPTLPA